MYEPIWGRTSLTGVANDDRYRFSNFVLRGGLSRDVGLGSDGNALHVDNNEQGSATLHAMGFEILCEADLGA